MKLLLCKSCSDIIKLTRKWRKCQCKQTRGKYVDEVHAFYSGPFAVPLGIANASLRDAIRSQPETGSGSRFEAWVIAKDCSTFEPFEKAFNSEESFL